MKKATLILISALLAMVSAYAQVSYALSLADGEKFPNSVPHPVIRSEKVK